MSVPKLNTGTTLFYPSASMGKGSWHSSRIPDRKDRTQVEGAARMGSIRAVVCTSSLDLGVDFSPVEQVIQIGGPKELPACCKEQEDVDTNPVPPVG